LLVIAGLEAAMTGWTADSTGTENVPGRDSIAAIARLPLDERD
jgi:hypothetical protein